MRPLSPRRSSSSSSLRRLLVASLLALPWANALSAQSTERTPPLVATTLQTVGLSLHEGSWLGIGPDYKVTFATEVEFTPALGASAPHDLPLAYRLEGVGRGAATLPVPTATPVAGVDEVRYEHGVTTARYTLRADGVKQDFVFTQLPRGAGDLVVRGRVRTELPVANATATQVDFAFVGIGGVRIDSVVGIDARGRRVAGELRIDGDVLEYRLPAAFVDTAALPLVLDPLIGSYASITTINADRNVDVAYDADTDTWLMVWSREFSSSNHDIRGQRILGTGALQGGLLSIESSSATYARRPSVGNVAMRDAFVVAWEQINTNGATGAGIHARGVLAATGAMTSAVIVRSGTNYGDVTIGGEASETDDDDVLCLWNASIDAEWCQLTYTAAGTIGVLPATTIPGVTSDDAVTLSTTGGQNGRYLLVWQSSAGIGTKGLKGRVVDRNQNAVSNDLQIASGPYSGTSGTAFEPGGVDGDGATWTVSFWTTTIQSLIPQDSTARVRPVALSGGTLCTLPSVALALQDPLWNDTSVACRTTDSSLVAWRAGGDLRLTSLDSFNCEVCEGSYLVDATTNDIGSVAMAARGPASSANGGDALIVWSSTTATGAQIRYVRFGSEDGLFTEVAAPCGAGGRLRASCAFPAHPMRFLLTDAPASAACALVLSLDRLDYDCGPCTLVPDPFSGFVTALTTTDALGVEHFDIGLPSSASGRRFYAQFATAGTGCLGGFDVSSALSIRIQ